MSFPTMNAGVVSTEIMDLSNAAGSGGIPFLATARQIAIAPLPGVVDVSGMEFHMAINLTSATAPAQTLASAGSTVAFAFGDAGTTATGTASGNHLYIPATTQVGADGSTLVGMFNARTNGYTVHEGVKSTGTSTTDLDADDWVSLHMIANATGLAGMITTGFAFVYGKPGQIN